MSYPRRSRAFISIVGVGVILAVVLSVFITPANAGMITVGGKANLFAAGSLSPPASGILPPMVTFGAGPGKTVTFTGVSGVLNAGVGWPDVGPEGGTIAFGQSMGTNIFSANGISGLIHNRFLFLAGVFLSAATPTPGNEPARLDFRGSDDFAELSPVIGQTFFIGDGLTGRGAGSVQVFHIPRTATRLYLGFVDGYAFGWPNGLPPGFYGDNSGSLSVTVNIVPEPNGLMLAGLGLASLFPCLIRRCRHA